MIIEAFFSSQYTITGQERIFGVLKFVQHLEKLYSTLNDQQICHLKREVR